MSGVAVNDACVDMYNRIKMKKERSDRIRHSLYLKRDMGDSKTQYRPQIVWAHIPRRPRETTPT